jgi:hypothetical protein
MIYMQEYIKIAEIKSDIKAMLVAVDPAESMEARALWASLLDTYARASTYEARM